MFPKDGDGIRINVDSDQTAPLVALLQCYQRGSLIRVYIWSDLSVPVFRIFMVQEDQRLLKFNDNNVNRNTVDSRYLEIQGTLKKTTRYPYFDISDLSY